MVSIMAKIVEYLVAMVGAHGDGYVGAAGIKAFLLFKYDVFHYRVHIRAACQMFILEETAVCCG